MLYSTTLYNTVCMYNMYNMYNTVQHCTVHRHHVQTERKQSDAVTVRWAASSPPSVGRAACLCLGRSHAPTLPRSRLKRAQPPVDVRPYSTLRAVPGLLYIYNAHLPSSTRHRPSSSSSCSSPSPRSRRARGTSQAGLEVRSGRVARRSGQGPSRMCRSMTVPGCMYTVQSERYSQNGTVRYCTVPSMAWHGSAGGILYTIHTVRTVQYVHHSQVLPLPTD